MRASRQLMLPWLAFALLSLVWGSSYLWIRIGIEQLSPVALVGLRLLTGAIVLLLIGVVRRRDLRLPLSTMLVIMLIAGINTSCPFLLITWGEETVPSGLASVLNSTVPIFSVLLAGALLRDEPITLQRLAGVLAGFCGVVLLLSRDLGHASMQWESLAGQGAIVLSSVCYATGAVLVRRLLRGIPPMTLATYIVGAAAVQTMTLSLLFSPPPLTSLRPSSVVAVLWLGALGSALAYMLAYFILGEWGASRYTLIAYMMPLIGVTLGIIVLKEVVDWRILAGSGLVVGGVILASFTRRQGREQVTSPLQVESTASAASDR